MGPPTDLLGRALAPVPVLLLPVLLAALLAPGSALAEELRAVDLASGSHHVCARLSDDSVRCWGQNGQGQVGDERTSFISRPTTVAGVSGATRVVITWNFTVAATAGGSLVYWGAGRLPPRPLTGFGEVQALAAGAFHFCALDRAGLIRCVGRNDHGQLGDGSTRDATRATLVPGLTDVVELAAGGDRTCARVRRGDVYCWGASIERGTPAPTPAALSSQLTPQRVPRLHKVAQLALGARHSCALLENGTVRCWGFNGRGRAGQRRTSYVNEPTEVPGLGDVVQLTVQDQVSCAVGRDGRVRCWGRPWEAFDPPGAKVIRQASSPEPQRLPGLEGVVEARLGGGSQPVLCVRFRDGQVACHDSRRRPPRGVVAQTGRFAPFGDRGKAVSLVVGQGHQCLVRPGGEVACWGDNYDGAAGIAQLPVHPPTRIAGLERTPGRLIAAGSRTCILPAAGGTPICWGAGQVRPAALQLSVDGQLDELAGSFELCTRSQQGKVGCWSSSAAEGPPVPIALPAPAVEVRAGGAAVCARLASGRVACWNRSDPTPVLVQGVRGAVALTMMPYGEGCALGGPGAGRRVRCWSLGRVGQNGERLELSPSRERPELRGARALAGAARMGCLIRDDGLPSCWGLRPAGAPAVDIMGTAEPSSLPGTADGPRRVEGLARARRVVAGEEHLCLLDTAGQVHCLGTLEPWRPGRIKRPDLSPRRMTWD